MQHVKGGGVHYVSDFTSPETRLFKAGLKHDPVHEDRLMKGTLRYPSDTHDKIDYERGAIIHSRSSANQHFNFHFMFGGFKTYTIQRWLINHYYRRNFRVAWLPFLIAYSIGCYGMRKYDTAAYNFFYFSD